MICKRRDQSFFLRGKLLQYGETKKTLCKVFHDWWAIEDSNL